MTTKSDQFRGLFLAALMVLSVFTGSIAFAGSTVATDGSAHFDASSYADGDTITLSVTDSAANSDTGTAESVDVTVATDGDQVTATLQETGTDTGTFTGAITVQQAPDNTDDSTLQAQSDETISADYQNSSVTNTADFNADTTNPSVNSAVEFDSGTIEVAFDEDVQAVGDGDVTVYVDGEEQSGVSVGSADGTSGQLLLTGLDDVTPNQDLTVNIEASDSAGNTFNQNVSVEVTSSTFTQGDNPAAYEGAKVAYDAGSTDSRVLIEKTDGEYVFDGNTGANSQLYVFDTEGYSTSVGYNFTTGSDTTTLSLRSFNLNADAPSSATEKQSFNVDVSANAGSSPITAKLVNNNDEVVDTVSETLDGSGKATVSLTPDSTGNFTVEVVDDNSGVTASTDTITVEQKGETTVSFANSEMSNQRGDVVELPVSLTNSDTSYVKIGSSSTNFLVYGNVTDVDGDGEVTLLVNTYDASSGNDYGVSAAGDDDFTLNESASNEGVSTPLDTGTYDLEAGVDGVGADAQAVSSFTVQERSTDGISTFVTTSGTEFSGAEDLDNLAQRTDVAAGDTAIVAVEATGIYGFLEANDISSNDAVNLTIEESERPQNRDKRTISADQIETVTDAENNTVYFVIDTSSVTTNEGNQVEAGQGYDVTFTVSGDSSLAADDQSVSTEFDIVKQSVSIDTEDDETVNLPATEDATVSGTSTLAPGTELSVQIRSDGNEFIYTNSVTVDAEGNWETSYDLSEAEDGTAFTVKVRNPITEEADGVVVEDVTTETPTTETPTTEAPTTTTATPTSTETDTPTKTDTTTEDPGSGDSDGGVPGFGLAAALVALLAAALLAYRRD